jgi:hypothetical protein
MARAGRLSEQLELFVEQHGWTVLTALQTYAKVLRGDAKRAARFGPGAVGAFREAAEKVEKVTEAWLELMEGPDDDESPEGGQ